MTKEHKDALVGAIEAGGTKYVCAVGTGPGSRMLAKTSFETSMRENPTELLAEVACWLSRQESKYGKLKAIGIASFGPIDINTDSPTYGYITSTPKQGWNNTDFVGQIRKAFSDIPIGFDTDVNGAALGEYYWGNASGLSDFVYITIGTGIGAGGMVGGQLIHGLVHPEMGHMLIPQESGDNLGGMCPYHGPCWEGLCSGTAMQKRYGSPAENIPPAHPAWEFETRYTAYAIANIVCILSPQRVIVGGGVTKAGQLGEEWFFKSIQEQIRVALKGYIVSPFLRNRIGDYIVPPLLGDQAGICGAIALGQSVIASYIENCR